MLASKNFECILLKTLYTKRDPIYAKIFERLEPIGFNRGGRHLYTPLDWWLSQSLAPILSNIFGGNIPGVPPPQKTVSTFRSILAAPISLNRERSYSSISPFFGRTS